MTDDLIPLRKHHAYLRQAPTSAFWWLAPHLIMQHTDSSCSLATATMLVNAIRGREDLLPIGKTVTEVGLLERLGDEAWRREITPGVGRGLTLHEFAQRMNQVLASYDLASWRVAARSVDDGAQALPALCSELAKMESGEPHFIAVNFHFGVLYGDPLDTGHLSPVGAYDATSDRALILDVYKQEYEPFWVPLEKLGRAMAVKDKQSGAPRGYAVIGKEV